MYATAPWVLRVQLDRKPNCIARTTIIKAAYACASNGRQSAFTRNQSFAAKIRQRCRASLHRQRTSYRWCKYNDYMKQRRQRATYSQFISGLLKIMKFVFQINITIFYYNIKYIYLGDGGRPCGAMDSALDFESSGCGFESHQG